MSKIRRELEALGLENAELRAESQGNILVISNLRNRVAELDEACEVMVADIAVLEQQLRDALEPDLESGD